MYNLSVKKAYANATPANQARKKKEKSISHQRFRATMWWKAESDLKLEEHLLVQSFVFLLNHEPFTVFGREPSFGQKRQSFIKVLMYFSEF